MQYLLMLYSDESGWNALTPAQQRDGVVEVRPLWQ